MTIFRREADLTSLLERCKRSDSMAWAVLVDRFQSLVYSIPKRMNLNDDDAADVFQNTFQALHRNLDRIENAETLPKWLAVTASRECLRIKRVSSRATPTDATTLEEVVAEEERNAEEMAVAASEADEVRRAVSKLADRCRGLLESLYFEEESSYQAISDRLGIPMGAIGPTRARCLEKLRKLLEDRGFF